MCARIEVAKGEEFFKVLGIEIHNKWLTTSTFHPEPECSLYGPDPDSLLSVLLFDHITIRFPGVM